MCCGTCRCYSLFMGAVEIIFSVTGIITCLYLGLGQENAYTKADSTTSAELWESYREGFILNEIITSAVEPMLEESTRHFFSLICTLLFSFLELITSTLLVAGILNERPKLMHPYIFVEIVSYVLGVFVVIILYLMQMNSDNNPEVEVFENVKRIFAIGFGILFFMPIYILYRRMCEAHNQSEEIALRNSAAINTVQYGPGGDV